MDIVIETLSLIEERAANIVLATANEKKALKEDYKKKSDDYLKQAEASMASQLEQLNLELTEQLDRSISDMENNSAENIRSLQNYYDTNHTAIANKIFNNIIGV